MAAAAGILNQSATAQSLLSSRPTPMDDSTTTANNGTSADASSATISANDFLTLLVTEMQNQDPTADTDPNEYVNQLVNVNSLEQLIDINQTLTSAYGSTSSARTEAADSTATPQSVTTQPASALHVQSAIQPAASITSSPASTLQSSANLFAPGNLSIPSGHPAAQRLAQALGGGQRQQTITGQL